MSEVILELRGVHKSFGRAGAKPVLTGVDLAISRGRVLGLLGKNGAGKTTLLKCALGLMRMSAGTATIFGEDSWNLSAEAKARIGYVPQKLEFQGWLKVRQTLAYFGSFYPRWNGVLVELLRERWELDAEARVGTLSAGQVQKLGLLVAMGHEPELLVLDEPAASLDPEARRAFLAAVVDIAADWRRTVILSTHLTSDLERVATDIVILKNGTVFYDGAMDDLKESVRSLVVTSDRALPSRADIPGVLAYEIMGNHAVITLAGVTPSLVDELERTYKADVEVRDLTLEDIFVEMHRG
ncbi:MAG TPA: ABC transporter ATP-binding protein [Terriglobia bacterium]|nr:ABC transporter ATP-binding protein [Terriglobia bacterium]